MSHCPISFDPLPQGTHFSKRGLRQLHPKLAHLQPLDLSHEEQLRQARLRADKMSVQGVQPKLSAILKIKEGRFEIVDKGGTYLLKPNPPLFQEVPANEAVTMAMAAASGIEVPPHGLVPAADGSWVYFIRRFDRRPRNKKIHVEDFAQLTGATRDSKYESSLEQVAKIVEKHCTFPALEKEKLARRLLFCFLTGNEDMHLKNFSLQSTGGTVSLTPAYDLLNTTLVLEQATEESALPLAGKKSKLTRELWIDYFCKERLKLPNSIIGKLQTELQSATTRWIDLIASCQLSKPMCEEYIALLEIRATALQSQ